MTRAVIKTPSAKLVCHNDSYPEWLWIFLKKKFRSNENEMIKILKTNKTFEIKEWDLDDKLIDYTYLINNKWVVKCLDFQWKEIQL